MTTFVTFYSYKGGVGRTKSLENVAWLMAEDGLRVLVVDMDLEAPDLHLHPNLRPPGTANDPEFREPTASLEDVFPTPPAPPPGVVEFTREWVENGAFPGVADYVYEVEHFKHRLGGLWVMPGNPATGMSLPWDKIAVAKQFPEDFKQAISALGVEFVLIDSRTGLSDLGGLTTHRLADSIALVFNLDLGSLEGTVRASRSIPLKTPIIPIASPVPHPNIEPETRVARRLAWVHEALRRHSRNVEPICITYDADMALLRDLAVRRPNSFPAEAAYREIVLALHVQSAANIAWMRENIEHARAAHDLDAAEAKAQAFVALHPEHILARHDWARTLIDVGLFAQALDVICETLRQRPNAAELHVLHCEATLTTNPVQARQALNRARSLLDANPPDELTRGSLSRRIDALSLRIRDGERLRTKEVATRITLKPDSNSRPVRPTLKELPVSDLRDEFVASTTQAPPYPTFSPDIFWEQLCGSPLRSNGEKVQIALAGINGTLSSPQVRDLHNQLETEREQISEFVGADGFDKMTRLIRQFGTNATDPVQMSQLAHRRPNDAVIAYWAGQLADDHALLLRAVGDAAGPEILASSCDALVEWQSEHPEETPREILRQCVAGYTRLVETWPNSEESQRAQHNCGFALLSLASMTGRKRERHALLRRALEKLDTLRPPANSATIYNRACVLSLLHRFDEAEETLSNVLFAPQSVEDYRLLRKALEDDDLLPLFAHNPAFRESVETVALALDEESEPDE